MEPSKKTYYVTNWKAYNQALVDRRLLTLWLDEEAVKNWSPEKSKKGGRPFLYSPLAIEAALTVRYALTFKSVEGFLSSIFALLGSPLSAPDYTLLCKRQNSSQG